ncbi:MAG TPA: GDP-mannose 4,6-dehydratase, partial [Chryseosolibacter sp.]|nr:GDP-mannose 4,6-dehydratase [Chryseosolibacter sp.]
MNSKKVLVTGGAGYIGAHTAVELKQAGYEPVIVDNLSRSDETLLSGMQKIIGSKPNFYHGDCADKEFLQRVFSQEAPISAVLHFAALKSVGESVAQPLLYFKNNVDSLLTLLEVMR